MAVRPLRVAIGLLVVAVLVGALVAGTGLYFAVNRQPAPWTSSCTATVGGSTVRLELAQARNAAIIAGVAGRRGLPPRAASIALATAWQESGLRNLDYGDRDSLGLFQQRPSQGWGTKEQIMDPHYAANAFYAAMELVSGWQTADLGNVAQAVQRSGYPDAYDKYIDTAKTLASSLAGETPASFACAVRNVPDGDAAGLAALLKKTLPKTATVTTSGTTVTVDAPDARTAWTAAELAVATTADYGVRGVSVAGKAWKPAWPGAGSWDATTNTETKRVLIQTA